MTLVHKGRFSGGEPCGTMVFAIPDVEAIDRALINAEQSAHRLTSEADEDCAVGQEVVGPDLCFDVYASTSRFFPTATEKICSPPIAA